MHFGPRLPRRFSQLALGLFLYGIALAMMVRAAIGVSPWDVLTQGVDRQTGLGFGLITVLVGALVLLLWIPLRQRPGLGTIANVLFIGPSVEVGLAVIPTQTEPLPQGVLFAGGLALLAVATGLYIGAGFGPGPRDGLMTGIHRRTGWPIWVGRSIVELTVLGVGWILGGNVGIGTVAFALLIGPMVNVTLPLLTVPLDRTPQVLATGKEVPA
ncbi:YitT family protein [Lysobacter korlensis]|uniref:YitT family protein n=1 Tax=Lysobacter korlensis TaxID=553636 RepID=A0ABV6RU22_9GAMM